MEFVNRVRELNELRRKQYPLVILFGRRRIGKTSLIENWDSQAPLYYSQAIEASEIQQVQQLMLDLAELLPPGLVAKSWLEFFPILSLVQKNCVVVFDEFPYLVKTTPSLPSQLQRWIDHHQPPHLQLVLLGSSQTMMNSLFLSSSAPLYERAGRLLLLEPMAYNHFCEALDLSAQNVEHFELFSMIGGVPKYWTYLEKDWGIVETADELFFKKGALLEAEPERLLKDEDLNGLQAKAIFEALGRGAHKPSEIAARLGIKQTGLSKPMNLLLQTSLVKRSLPFGEHIGKSKKTLYNIADHALEFWYGTYSPHRSRWHHYPRADKEKFIHDHAAKILEHCYRDLFPDAQRYWDGKRPEFDCVRYADGSGKKIIVSEIKHRLLSPKEKNVLQDNVQRKFNESRLKERYELSAIEILGTNDVIDAIISSNGSTP